MEHARERISYLESGDTAGTPGMPVVLLHDIGPLHSVDEVSDLFDRLAEDRVVVAPDLSHRVLSHDDYLELVAGLVAEVAARHHATVDVVAVGSMGELAAEAIVRASRHVRSLAIVSPTGFRPRHLVARLRAKARTRLASFVGLADPNVATRTYAALPVPTCFVHGEGEDVGKGDIDRRCLRRAEVARAMKHPHRERPLATAAALRAFWRTVAHKPELRVIRGGRDEHAR